MMDAPQRAAGGFARPARVVRRAALGLLVSALAATGCGSARAPSGSPVDITLRDFRIHSSTPSVAGSEVVFRVHNDAPATHEFVVVPTDLPPDALPLAPDGLSVNEDAFDPAGELSEVPAGTTATLQLRLPPGRYVFFCNLEGHYLGGMHGSLQVTATSSTGAPGA